MIDIQRKRFLNHFLIFVNTDINIEKLSEENKMLIEKQAESQAIIDALEKDNHEKADKISSLEKLYESLYKGLLSIYIFITKDSSIPFFTLK